MIAVFKKLQDREEQGFMLLETLVAIALLGIFGLGLARSTIVGLQTRKRTMIHQQANQIAINKLEEYSQTNASNFNVGDYDYTTIEAGGLEYDVISTASQSSDGAKTVYIDVSAVSQQYPVTISLSNTYY